MAEDDVARLALNILSQPGLYAMLLGSGVSSGAGIPTGHAVTLDLIRRFAAAKEESPGSDPEAWFTTTTGIEPRYSDLLGHLSLLPAGRSAILRGYFEATQEDKEAGRKVPTATHRSIASMAVRGLIQVIVTTNFDRLLEQALEEAGLRPVVIHNAASAEGAPPFQHTALVLIKLHGDYLDNDILNTSEELATYDPVIQKLLARVIDEYGLVVCGWSGEWDVALRESIERCVNRRYPMYFGIRGAPGQHIKQLASLRGAALVPIESADQFFSDLDRSLLALAKSAAPGQVSGAPLTTPGGMVRQLKAVLPDPQRRIELRELVLGQAVLLSEANSLEAFPVAEPAAPRPNVETIGRRMKEYEGLAAPSMALFASGCYWAEDQQTSVFVDALRAVVGSGEALGGFTAFVEMRRYPALLLFYAGGISAVGAGRPKTLHRLQSGANTIEPFRGRSVPLVVALIPAAIVPEDAARGLPELENSRFLVPISEYLFGLLRPVLDDVLRVQADYERAFDHFEVLNALVQADLMLSEQSTEYFYTGRFGWKAKHARLHPLQEVGDEIAQQGANWPMLEAGAFGGDVARAQAALALVTKRVDALPWF